MGYIGRQLHSFNQLISIIRKYRTILLIGGYRQKLNPTIKGKKQKTTRDTRYFIHHLYSADI